MGIIRKGRPGWIAAVSLAGALFGTVAYNYLVFFRLNGVVEDVAFPSGEIELRGWLVEPTAAGPHPAVVILHGSGRQDRATGFGYRTMANALLSSGFSVLIYDKRGCGESGGVFEKAHYADFIADGLAAVDFLGRRPDVRADAIGLLGSSEGGWFTPEIAVRSGKVAFIINRAGPPVSWIDTNTWEVRNEMIDAGLEGPGLKQGLALRRKVWEHYLDFLRNPARAEAEHDEINAELHAFHARIGNVEVPLPDRMSDDRDYLEALARDIAYDPRPFIEALDVPLLDILAEDDQNVPFEESSAYLAGLRAAGKDIEIRSIPGVRHSMLSFKALFNGGYDPAFTRFIGPWALEHIRQ